MGRAVRQAPACLLPESVLFPAVTWLSPLSTFGLIHHLGLWVSGQKNSQNEKRIVLHEQDPHTGVWSAVCEFSRAAVPNLWHQGLVSWKMIFPWTGGVGREMKWGWFQDDSSTVYLLCIYF